MQKVLFYTCDIGSTNAQKFCQIDFDIIRENGYELIVSDKRQELFKFWKYDIFFGYFFTWNFFRALPLALCGKKVFLTGGIDSLDKKSSSPKSYLFQKVFFFLCYVISTKCIIVSDNDWENIERIYHGRLKKKLVKSYHVIDVDKFLSNDFKNRKKRFVTICWQGALRNIQRKGIVNSLKLFKYLIEKDEFRDYHYLIAGRKGIATDYLETVIREMGLKERVKLTGEISEDEKIELLKNSKYYFQLSSYEGFGLAALEAEAAGDIVIHSNNGGLKNVVGKYGVIVDCNHIDEQLDIIYKDILEFDCKIIEEAQKWVKSAFAYNRRKNEFAQLFKEGK